MRRRMSSRARLALIGAMAAAAIALLGLAWLVGRGAASSPPAAVPSTNPLAGDADAVAAGRLLYEAHCAICHGESGQGGGLRVPGESPSLTDLTDSLAPGAASDGQLHLWIRDGIPGSGMPSFGRQHSADEIWQIVAYLRTLGSGS